MSRRLLRRSSWATAVCLLGVLTTPGAPAHASGLNRPLSGAYEAAASPGLVDGFGRWRGARAGLAEEFLAKETWDKIEHPDWWASHWQSSGYQMVYSVPLIPDSGGSLAAGAGGSYDVHFQELARTLVKHGQASSRLRLGWEFNAGWFRWGAKLSPADFAEYWRHIVAAMRSVQGAHFSFVWNPAFGYQQFKAELAYPGDGYVDEIGLDVYDESWIPNFHDAQARFDDLLHANRGLSWWDQFATSHGKPLCLPEWGLTTREDGHGGGDNSVYVRGIWEFVSTHAVSWEAYFDKDAHDGLHALRSGRYPLGSAQYLAYFGVASHRPAARPSRWGLPPQRHHPSRTFASTS